MGEWEEWCTVRVTVMVSMTAPISRKQKKVGMKYLAKILGNPVYDSLCSAPWLFCFTLLELVKGGYRGVKRGGEDG